MVGESLPRRRGGFEDSGVVFITLERVLIYVFSEEWDSIHSRVASDHVAGFLQIASATTK